jgi:hypothetical protein
MMVKKAAAVFITMMLGVAGLAACGLAGPSMDRAQYSANTSPQSTAVPTMAAMEMEESAGLVADDADGATRSNTVDVPQQERVILRNASIQIIVEDTEATIDAISTMANEMGGWVVTANSSSHTRSDDVTYTNGNITVRVPAERLDEALNTIREGALDVEREAVNGRDVTEEYVDLSSRLSNLEAAEAQLVEILESAYTVEDVLAVQAELTTVRGEIEQIEGRLRYFDEAAAFSSVAVTVREKVPQLGNVQVAGWSPGGTAQNALGVLVVIGQFVVDAAIVLVIVGAPMGVALGVVVWGARRLWQAVRGGRKVTPTAE